MNLQMIRLNEGITIIQQSEYVLIRDVIEKMQRLKQPQQLFERIQSKHEKGLNELKCYIQTVDLKQRQNILRYFLAVNLLPNVLQYYIQALSILSNAQSAAQLISPLLKYLLQTNVNVVLRALSVVYKLIKCFDCTDRIIDIFTGVYCLVSHPEPQIRRSAAFLDHTVRTIISTSYQLLLQAPVSNQTKSKPLFPGNTQLILVIAERMGPAAPIAKQFLIDWLIFLGVLSVPYLSLFINELFRSITITKSRICLEKYRALLYQHYTVVDKLESVLQIIIIYAKRVPRERQALNWVYTLTDIFARQVLRENNNQVLSPIFVYSFTQIVAIVWTEANDQKTNNLLLEVFPLIKVRDALPYHLCNKASVLLKWVNLTYSDSNYNMKELILKVVQTLITNNQMHLLKGSKILEDHFQTLVQELFKYSYNFSHLNTTFVLQELLTLVHTQSHLLTLCKCITTFPRNDFRLRLRDAVIFLIVTHPMLHNIRNKLRIPLFSSMEGINRQSNHLFDQLFSFFLQCEPALLMLALLSQKYALVWQLMRVFSKYQSLDLRCFLKHLNLLSCPNIKHTDLLHSKSARKAYLSLLMAVPHGKYFELLHDKLSRLPIIAANEFSKLQQYTKLISLYESKHTN